MWIATLTDRDSGKVLGTYVISSEYNRELAIRVAKALFVVDQQYYPRLRQYQDYVIDMKC